MEIEVLPVDVENIEQQNDRFAIDLDDNTYIFEIYWNPVGEFFSFNLLTKDDEPIVLGKRIIYGVDMLANVADERVPNVKIIPADKTGEAEKEGITLDNFMSSVKPVIVRGGS